MRVLVVSDIHGNWSALQAVAAAVPHDAVLCLGDIVGYGPEPAACLRWLRENRAQMVQGNHDRALADDVPPRCRPDFEWLATASPRDRVVTRTGVLRPRSRVVTALAPPRMC